MKVEVDYSEIEALRQQLASSEAREKELTEKIKSLNEVEVRSQAIDLAQAMFSAVQNRVFRELGYPDTRIDSYDANFADLEHWLGQKWIDSDKLVVEVGEIVTNRYKAGIVKLYKSRTRE